MPRYDDQLMPTIFYIFPNEQAWERNEEEDGATGFFFAIPSKIDADQGYVYAITNLHVIRNRAFENPTIGINTLEGERDKIITSRDDWYFHPENDDVAACNLGLEPDLHEIGVFTEAHIATEDFIIEQNVGIGDEIMMLGRHRSVPGRKKNLPTARFGNISKMPVEQIKNPFTDLYCDSYLAEMRSISGFSGSPVTLSISPFSQRWKRREDGKKLGEIYGRSFQRLLGIDWGHLTTPVKVLDQSGNPHPDKLHIVQDSALAGIVPAWKIQELLYSDEVLREREKEEEGFAKKLNEGKTYDDEK